MTALLPQFRLAHPRSVSDAIATSQENAGSRFIAGGTDLIVNARHGLGKSSLLIDLSGIRELAEIRASDHGIRIGSMVSIAALTRDAATSQNYRAVKEAAEAIAGPGHRLMGTVGGNLCLDTRCIYYNQSEWWRRANGFCLKHGGDTCHVAPQGRRCHAAFAGDLAPAFLALRAEVEIAGASGCRRIPVGDLYVEDGSAHLTLAPDELIVAVVLPPNPPPSSYAKVRVRGAIDFPLAGVAVALAAANGVIQSLNIGLTGTNSRPFLLAGTDAIAGRPVDEKVLQQLDRLVQKQVQPMRTTIASAHYRRLAAAALACRLVASLSAAKEA
ncbi:MAG: 4-hydroxybenzoyl-CoA reductase subunit beta [Hyphomicrobiaceae bacterium]|nr:MAG: 4-hydroxybenzoyl-CoA reductase subunit beta [Hyphomicrobiaceae bacterium]